MSEVILHVGPVKTGSTFLQGLLWTNREDLERQGMLYPCEYANEVWFAANDVQDGAFIHFELPEAKGTWSRVRDRVLAFPGRSIMSHEILGLSTQEHVARIVESLQPATLHVVVMARSLATFLPSVWQEKVKSVDPDVSWPDYVRSQRENRSPWSDASAIVNRWLRHVPPHSVHVITVPPRATSRDLLLTRFARAIGIDATMWDTHDAARNESLDAIQVEILRRLNEVSAGHLNRRAQRRLVHAFIQHMRTPDKHRRLLVPSSERGWIDDETARRVDALRTSGAVIHGDLGDLWASAECWATDSSPISDADLLHEALLLLSASSRSDASADGRNFV